MYLLRPGASRWLASTLVVVLLLAALAPPSILAQTGDLPVGSTAVVTNTGGDPVLVRETPGYHALVLLHVREGMTVEITGGPAPVDDGSVWYGVKVDETLGYIVRDYLEAADPAQVSGGQTDMAEQPPAEAPTGPVAVDTPTTDAPALTETAPPEAPEESQPAPPVEEPVAVAALQEAPADTSPVGGNGTAVTTAPLNLRSGPGISNPVLLVIPSGASVAVTGNGQSGFLPVTYNGTSGWASAGFLQLGGGAPPSQPSGMGTDTTTAPLNFRNGPGTGYGVIAVIPAGTSVTLTGQSSGGFISVSSNGNSGWVSASYVTTNVPAPAPTPEPPPASPTGTARTTTDLHLRGGPSTADRSLTIIPSGSTVSLTGQSSNGFLSVSWNGLSGWSYAGFLDTGSAPPPAQPQPQPAPSTGTAVTTANVYLRSGPGTSHPALTVIPSGSTVTVTGSAQNGFLPVVYNGASGWSSASFLNVDGQPATPPLPPSTSTMVTTANLDLRASASLSAAVLTVIPNGSSVSVTGSGQSGFLPVTYGGQSGWASASFLTTGGNPGGNPGANPPPDGGSGISWPVSGGTWSITQGYNGGTHQNRSSTAQYYYALDIARVDGNSAGQAVYAPASGTILWLDAGSGGIAIDMGNGYTIAMFHCTSNGGLARGQSVAKGQHLGAISGPGGAGYASTPHVDMTLWYTGGGGRAAAPYTGGNAISGMSFPDTGGWNQHAGTRFNP